MPDSTQVIQTQGDPLLNLLLQYIPHGLGGLSVFLFVLWKLGVLNRFLKALSGFLLALTKEDDNNTKQPKTDDRPETTETLENVVKSIRQSIDGLKGSGLDSSRYDGLIDRVTKVERLVDKIKIQTTINKNNIDAFSADLKEYRDTQYSMQALVSELSGIIKGLSNG
jgi:hypothetical protein